VVNVSRKAQRKASDFRLQASGKEERKASDLRLQASGKETDQFRQQTDASPLKLEAFPL
jgi:hypothetical protein